MTLAETQALLWSLVTTDDPVARRRISDAFVGSPDLPGEDRVRIYADMYLWRIVDALREDFAKTAALFGEEAYRASVRSYLTAHPSTHPDLGRLGAGYAAFLGDRRGSLPRPDLPDLAGLEWARAEVFLEAAAEPIASGALAALGPWALPETRIAMVPATRTLALDFDALAVWRALEAGCEPVAPVERPTFAVVWRRGFDVFHAEIDADEARALDRARAGGPFAAVCEAFSGRGQPAEAALEAIGSWFTEGMVAAVHSG